MPALVCLSQDRVERGRTVPGDKECDDLLQELRQVTGEDWIVLTYTQRHPRGFFDAVRGRPPISFLIYSLYADCHGEWQVINCFTREGVSIFNLGAESRETVMNYMLGYVAGIYAAQRRPPLLATEGDRQ